ncbi:hypothetical protein ACF9IK_08025 [Kitasatospora hibisci]|uniref:hypothetical protein n=1 Tax=Kitasatospora hibisci TaxID=3369522 RepID=UPI0037540940
MFGGGTYDDYQVRIDQDFLPIRTVPTATVAGRRTTGPQDFENRGKPGTMPTLPTLPTMSPR